MIDELIQATEKKLDLLKELKESQHYEQCIYDVVQLPDGGKFIVIEIATKKEVRFDYPARLVKWFDRIKADKDKIYNYNKLI